MLTKKKMEGYKRNKRHRSCGRQECREADGRCGNYKSGGFSGSYTVEAAMVVPVVFFVLAALMVGAFYIHDRAVCQSIVCEIAACGSSFMTEAERKKAMKEAESQIRGERFLGSQELGGNSAMGSREIQVSWQGRYPVPGMVMKYLSGGSLSYQAKWDSRIVDPADTVRKIRGIGSLTED